MKKERNFLSLQQARELAVKNFGTAKGLRRDPDWGAGHYEMWLGGLRVGIRPEGEKGSGCVEVRISTNYGCNGAITQLIDPETLEVDVQAEMGWTERARMERLRDWVYEEGPQACHRKIDKAVQELWRETRGKEGQHGQR